MGINRRLFIKGFLGWTASIIFFRIDNAWTETIKLKIEQIHRSREEWKALLTPGQFRILREEGTEPPYSSPFLEYKKKGVYVCAGCDLPLFNSEAKYDSRTGWPSFYKPIEGRLQTKKDYKLIWPRTEYHCARCSGHQGHIFNDGPPPTYKRWCNNGLALKFIPVS